jgi:molybdopterin-guanine dinucleotide biosynthesis protein A
MTQNNLQQAPVRERISLAIQAGGVSSRLGEDKALRPFLGRPLIQRVVERLAPIADEILVTSNRPEDYAFLGLRLVPDLLPGRGALGGLYTAVASASCPIVVVAACDLPFASLALLEAAVRLLVQEGMDVVVPRSAGGLEPMHAVYRRGPCLAVIKAAIESNRLKATDWFPGVHVRELSPGEIAAADPSGLAFWNVNTLDEFRQAEERAKLDEGGI